VRLLGLVAGLLAGIPAPGTVAGTGREAVVVVAVENMYSAPDDSRDVVSQATLGQTVELLETKDDFWRVRTPDGYEGWLPRRAALEYAAGAARYAGGGRVVEVTALMANLYREPDVTRARPLLQAPLATRLELTAAAPDGRWLTVRLPDGVAAYVQSGDVKAVPPGLGRPRGTPAQIVATARRFLGVPYLWGGMTARGIDCSGLVSRVYHANGVDLPRDADLQFAAANASPVPRRSLRAGDLVFFGSDAGHISHVGIYEGGGRFVDATTYRTPAVREDRLSDPHWAALYRGARRPR
jgi:hypothetical protein